MAVLQQQLLHSRAMIEEFLQDSQYLVSVLEMCSEPIDVN